ncbi:GmrSD restriction endonuclease domain-containing protein [Mycolicibacterium thermoresistibile]
MSELVSEIARASGVYRRFISGVTANNPIDRLQLFAYRSNTLESEVFKPVVLWLYDPELEPLPADQAVKALDVLESWMVRRMLVRATTNSYTQIAAELVTQLRKGERREAGDIVEGFFAGQSVGSRYWPDDAEVESELIELLAYPRLRRARLRMVLEAVEDHRRGWKGAKEGLGGERVARGKYHIEHIMPRKWQVHWPIDHKSVSESDRDKTVHTFGNLTLLTSKLNSKVSNAAWPIKRDSLLEHDVLKLNGDLLGSAGSSWNDQKIRARTQSMAAAILEIWPVPEGHKSGFGRTEARQKRRVGMDDLIAAGLLQPGTTIFARRKAVVGRTATVLPDGRIDVEGKAFGSPSAAARAISGKGENGWWFFVLSLTNKKSLADVLQEYIDQTATDIDDDEVDDVASSEDDDEDEMDDE